jgi:hypothetical protein
VKINPRTRRAFLQGLAGATLPLPFLSSFFSDKVLAATPVQARFVFMGHYFGRDIDFWYPKQDPATTSPEGVYYSKLSDITGEISYSFGSSFDSIRNKISIVRGLDGLQADNGHQWSMPLTASGTLNGTPSFGYSIDAVLEESKRFNASLTRVGALRTTASDSPADFSFSFSSKGAFGQALQTEWSPQAVYDKYFNPAALQVAAVANARKLRVSSQVMDDFKKLYSSPSIAQSDKARLDNYMTLLTSVEARLGVDTPACARAKAITGKPADAESLQSAMIDLEVAALACGITNVVMHTVRQVNASIEVNNEAAHSAAHNNGAKLAEEDKSVSQHAYYTRWVMTRVAELMTKLDAIDDGAGKTLLDNSFVLYGNGESRGFHTFYDMPVVIGGGQGKLKTGYYIDYRPRPLNLVDKGQQLIAGRPYNNLLVTLFKAMGFPAAEYQKFGQPGFGSYGGYNPALASHYGPFIAKPDDALPFLYVG